MKLILIGLFFASSVAHAGGVETIMESKNGSIMTPGSADISAILSKPAPSYTNSTLFLKHNDAILTSQMIDPANVDTKKLLTPDELSKLLMEGGVETIVKQLAHAQISASGSAAALMNVEKIKYAAETNQSVMVMVNGMNIPVEIQDSELMKSPEITEAIQRSLSEADWANLK